MNKLYLILRIPYHLLKRIIKNFRLLINKFFFRVTKKELKTKLKEIGLKKGILVYAHSSMSSFGYMEGGPNVVIDSILNLIGDKGTLVMPTFTHRTNIFDPLTTKCWTGKIPETFRLRKRTFRSIHPTHSIVALGPLAKEITKDHEKSKAPFDENSPFAKMIRKNSYIMMLGTENNSMIHYVQNKVNFPNLFLKRVYECKYKINNKIKFVRTKLHHPNGSITYICRNKPCSDVKFLIRLYKNKKFEERGYMKTIKIGRATCHLINTQDFVKIAVNYLIENTNKYKKEYFLLRI